MKAAIALCVVVALGPCDNEEEPSTETVALGQTIIQVQNLERRIESLETQLTDLRAEHESLKREHEQLEDWAQDRGYY